MRERGLKYHPWEFEARPTAVAPHAGAWIEMISTGLYSLIWAVAPHAGAWIEMNRRRFRRYIAIVAPHAGAWIEILSRRKNSTTTTSLPMRERGLKYA